jgi:multidrug efflux pump subunit AcrA (membrane-fusion protein)
VAQLKPGQLVRLMTDEEGSSGEAEIERIAPSVDATTGTVKVTLVLRRANGLRPGSFVRVGIVTDTHEEALLVPRSALVAEGRRWHLFRLKDGDEDHVELIEITRGFEEGDRVEILEGSGAGRPLSENDRIVVTGASSLSDGSAVQILDGTTEETDEGEGGDEAAEQPTETASRPAAEEDQVVAA